MNNFLKSSWKRHTHGNLNCVVFIMKWDSRELSSQLIFFKVHSVYTLNCFAFLCKVNLCLQSWQWDISGRFPKESVTHSFLNVLPVSGNTLNLKFWLFLHNLEHNFEYVWGNKCVHYVVSSFIFGMRLFPFWICCLSLLKWNPEDFHMKNTFWKCVITVTTCGKFTMF